MLFRQLRHEPSSALSYLVASRVGGEALLIDPVLAQLPLYLRLIEALGLRLVFALGTHLHADHESALPALALGRQCVTAMGRESRAAGVQRRLSDGEQIALDGLTFRAVHTPGHSADSYSFVMDDRVFTGDTLLIRSTGRTDQGGDAREQYDSLFNKILRLPGRTLVYPAHDYNGHHVSTIADERSYNPRLQVSSADEYAALMQGLSISDPRRMDAAAPSSLSPAGSLMRELRALHAALGRTPAEASKL